MIHPLSPLPGIRTRRRCGLATAGTLLLVILATPAIHAQAPAPREERPASGKKELTPQQKEMQRVAKIMAWARQAKPTQLELLRRMYEPIYKGNQQDLVSNQQYAQRCWAQAETIAKQANARPEVVRQWQTAAKLYLELAKQNQAIVKTLDAGVFNLAEPFAAIAKIEQQITQLTGKTPKRDWFMPSDFQRAAGPALPGGGQPPPPAHRQP
ncbi:MAG: hypothetical protein WC789_02985 [Lentisphaeria bacterium]|jgi:hypothetical protein